MYILNLFENHGFILSLTLLLALVKNTSKPASYR